MWFDAEFSFSEHVKKTCKPASTRYVTVGLDGIILRKWLSLLEIPWLVVIWTIVTLFKGFSVSLSIDCRFYCVNTSYPIDNC